jgi:hypothetical protein
MQYKTTTLDTSSQGYTTNVWVIDADVLKYRLDGTHGSHQVSGDVLGSGGVFAVEIRVPGDASWKSHTTGADGTDVVMVDVPIIEAMKVTVTPGSGAAPLITVTSRPRSFAT